ncbi:MAG: polysaccharide deacetylase family protein [Nitrospirae bacterium]|nr:polysaccharide deacetylase family protein [Nitrospirota bacterium]
MPPRTVAITFDDGFADNFEHAFCHLRDRGMTATWFVVSRDVGGVSGWTDADVPVRSMLSAGQLHEMAMAGMEIGAHTRTHARLPELSRAEIEEEVIGSKKELEDALNLSIKSFAYPYGLFNEESVEAVREAGFQIACTTRTGWFGSDPDILRVRRVAVFSHDSLSAFARKLAFATSDVSWQTIARYTAGRIKSRFFEK